MRTARYWVAVLGNFLSCTLCLAAVLVAAASPRLAPLACVAAFLFGYGLRHFMWAMDDEFEANVRELAERIDLALREIEELEAEGDSSLLRATQNRPRIPPIR